MRQYIQAAFAASFERLEKSHKKLNLLCFPLAEKESIDENYYYDVIIPSALALCERGRRLQCAEYDRGHPCDYNVGSFSCAVAQPLVSICHPSLACTNLPLSYSPSCTGL